MVVSRPPGIAAKPTRARPRVACIGVHHAETLRDARAEALDSLPSWIVRAWPRGGLRVGPFARGSAFRSFSTRDKLTSRGSNLHKSADQITCSWSRSCRSGDTDRLQPSSAHGGHEVAPHSASATNRCSISTVLVHGRPLGRPRTSSMRLAARHAATCSGRRRSRGGVTFVAASRRRAGTRGNVSATHLAAEVLALRAAADSKGLASRWVTMYVTLGRARWAPCIVLHG